VYSKSVEGLLQTKLLKEENMVLLWDISLLKLDTRWSILV